MINESTEFEGKNHIDEKNSTRCPEANARGRGGGNPQGWVETDENPSSSTSSQNALMTSPSVRAFVSVSLDGGRCILLGGGRPSPSATATATARWRKHNPLLHTLQVCSYIYRVTDYRRSISVGLRRLPIRQIEKNFFGRHTVRYSAP